MKLIYSILVMMNMWRNIILLYQDIRSIFFAFFRKRDELWEKDKLPIPIELVKGQKERGFNTYTNQYLLLYPLEQAYDSLLSISIVASSLEVIDED